MLGRDQHDAAIIKNANKYSDKEINYAEETDLVYGAYEMS
jgi:hypothetical protein